ncbi:type VI secretion system-associated protein TagO [Reyranella sp.]|uniref:type VI secretion system-associated protein TagO n=1 Tax=Reyranella sp. TaxID=1929291 RepID=UPI003D0B78D3
MAEAKRRGYSVAQCRGILSNSERAKLDPRAAQLPSSSVVAQPRPDPLILAIQSSLTLLGFELGTVDGFAGAKTTAAIEEFQRSLNEPADPKPSEALKMRVQTVLQERLEKVRALGAKATIGDWQLLRSRDKLSGKSMVLLSTQSIEVSPSPDGGRVHGELVLRCRDGQTAALVYFLKSLPSYQTPVSYRLDDKQIVGATWQNAVASGAVGIYSSSSSIPFIKSLIVSKTLVIRAQPKGQLESTLTFKLDGLREAILPLRQTCEWDGSQSAQEADMANDTIDANYLTGPQPSPPPPPYRYRLPFTTGPKH